MGGRKILCMGVLLIGLNVFFTFGAVIFVSPSGNDTNDGSIGSPIKTLTAARSKADQLKNSGPVKVFLRGGTYYLNDPVVFGPSNSGTAAAPIIYVAYGEEKPILSGGIKVNASWQDYKGSIKVTIIAKDLKVDQLFLNGKRQILARYPNYEENKILNGYKADCLNRASSWADPAEGPGYLRALHEYSWGGNSYIITGKSGSTVTYKWVGDNNRGTGMH